jgi:uncharacterized membrane protein YphA (DoxX/SURF4 family)
MKWVALIVRVVVALPFVVLAPDHFFHYLKLPQPENMPEYAKSFVGVLMPTGYMDVIKGLEVLGGLLVLSGRLTPLGIVILMPIVVNITLFDFLLMGKPGLGVILLGLLVFLMIAYRRYFAPFFSPTATVGG